MDKRKGLRLVAETRLVRFESRIEAALRRVLRSREKAVLSLTAAGPVDPFSGDTWPDQLAEELEPALNSILRDVKSDISKKVGAEATSTIDTEGQLSRMLGRMEGLGPETAERLERELAEAINSGDSVTQIKGRIRGIFDMAERRAATIARTETAVAVSEFGYDAAMQLQQSGTPLWQEWLATSDSRTRASHIEADGQIVRLGETFIVGGAELLHPSDPNGPADEIVNCRCSTVLSTEPPEE